MNDAVKTKITELVQANTDSAKGFSAAADNVTDMDCLTLFRELSEERSVQASQLQEALAADDEFPRPTGTLPADAHRLWIAIQGTITGRDGATIVSEVAKVEERLLSIYESALPLVEATAVVGLIRDQHASVSTACRHLTELQDALSESTSG